MSPEKKRSNMEQRDKRNKNRRAESWKLRKRHKVFSMKETLDTLLDDEAYFSTAFGVIIIK